MILFTSLSERRKNLLEQIGFKERNDFIQVDPVYNPDYHQDKQNLELDEVIEKSIEVAREKIRRSVKDARELTGKHLSPKDTVVAGADTVVYLKGRVLDRPLETSPIDASPKAIKQAEAKAKQMLSNLRGEDFYVLTGMVVTQGDNLDNEKFCCVVTRAKMKQFSDNDIERYIQTGEPLDKAGAFGIQERGVILFEEIQGSYSNVVGLPLVEFVKLLSDPLFMGRVHFRFGQAGTPKSAPIEEAPALRVVSVGDLNYDLVYDELPAEFFPKLQPPGQHIEGKLYRGTGGTAAIFAFRARKAGFKQCSVLGTIGAGPFGQTIAQDLHKEEINILLPADHNHQTGIALILRDATKNDTTLTITDPLQSLSTDDINKAKSEIEKAHVVFVSGYCLTDLDRREATLQVMEWTKKAGGLVVLDITVDMDKTFDFARFREMTQHKIDVLVAEIPTILAWLSIKDHQQNEWAFILEQIIPVLRQDFPVIFLRTSTYSHEIIASPTKTLGPIELDYSQRPPAQRLGYGDEKTAQHLYEFMSPRLLLASKSPRRYELLKQIVAENKIEVLVSKADESYQQNETPEDRVKRLAKNKARQVLFTNKFSSNIELVIGADTEIVLNGKPMGQPDNDQTARETLKQLSGKTHQVITGLALINRISGKGVVDSVSTQVKFKELSDSEIDQYIASGEPIGKAGAYGIQGKGALFVEKIEGSYSNVVGLPLERLAEILDKEFGIPIWDIDKVSNWRFPSPQGAR